LRSVVTHDPGGAARRHALARRVLPGLRYHQGDGFADRRPAPAGLSRHAGAGPAVLVVSGRGADAEADRFAPAAAVDASRRGAVAPAWLRVNARYLTPVPQASSASKVLDANASPARPQVKLHNSVAERREKIS
jgi:hypothetical protein